MADHDLRAVSLFSNCGAGDVGFRRAGFQFEVMAELDPRRLAVSVANHPGARPVPGDLRQTWPHVVAGWRTRMGSRRPDLLAACPPCQGMSSARGKRGLEEDADAGSADPRNLLVLPIAHVARELCPRVVVVENVPAFFTKKVRHPATSEPVAAAWLLVTLLSADYVAFPFEGDLAHYAVPQTRKRAFLTFVRRDEPGLVQMLTHGVAPYPHPVSPGEGSARPFTVRQALRALALPSLDASSPERAADPARPMHSVPVWVDERYRMVAAIPKHSGATAWTNDKCGDCGRRSDVGVDDAVCPRCGGALLRPVLRQRGGGIRLIKGFRTSSYKRMRSGQPAPTITTASGHVGSHSTIHPWENRLLSPLECAGIQTFPQDFNWGDALERWGQTNVREMIGEAVPPRFTYLHGVALRCVLEARWTIQPLPTDDRRCTKARKTLLAGCRRPRRRVART